MSRKIYLASSWRNEIQPDVVANLRKWGHEVYDFKNPAPGNFGFGWSSIDPNWKEWTPSEYRAALEHPIAAAGFKLDHEAMQWCDTCVLLLPSGRSASFEFGWCVGQGKLGIVFMPSPCEPELMYRGNEICVSPQELAFALRRERKTDSGRTEEEVRQGEDRGSNDGGSFRTFEPALASTPAELCQASETGLFGPHGAQEPES